MADLTFARDPDLAERAFFGHTIESERLVLRLPTYADATPMFDRWATDPEVTRYLLWRPHESIDETYLYLAQLEHAWNNHVGHRAWVVTERGESTPIGMIGVDYGGHLVGLGYVFARSSWGRGIATEAVATLTTRAISLRSEPLIERVEAITHVDNVASGRVLEKAGFVREGRLRRHTVFPAFGERAQDVYQWASATP